MADPLLHPSVPRRLASRLLRSRAAEDLRRHPFWRQSDREAAAIWALLPTLLPADRDGVDVGGSQGEIIGRMCEIAPTGRHVCFEPQPALARALRAGLPTVEVHEVALGVETGEAAFQVVPEADGFSGLRATDLPVTAERREVRVQVRRLDDVVDGDPALVKIDVEGGEADVLRGAVELLQRARPAVLYEHQERYARAYDVGPETFHDLLVDAHGYRIHAVTGEGPFDRAAYRRVLAEERSWNFVALPR